LGIGDSKSLATAGPPGSPLAKLVGSGYPFDERAENDVANIWLRLNDGSVEDNSHVDVPLDYPWSVAVGLSRENPLAGKMASTTNADGLGAGVGRTRTNPLAGMKQSDGHQGRSIRGLPTSPPESLGLMTVRENPLSKSAASGGRSLKPLALTALSFASGHSLARRTPSLDASPSLPRSAPSRRTLLRPRRTAATE